MGELVTVNFRGDVLFAVRRDDDVFLAIKPICDSLGLNWRVQRDRIQEDEILSEGCTLECTPTPGGPQEMLCLKLNLVNGWLLSVQDKRVTDPEVKQKLLTYKRECYEVLYRHFHKSDVDVPDLHDLGLPIGERRKLVVEARQTWGEVVAKQLWIKLDMPKVSAMFLDSEAVANQPDLPGLNHANDLGDEYKAA